MKRIEREALERQAEAEAIALYRWLLYVLGVVALVCVALGMGQR